MSDYARRRVRAARTRAAASIAQPVGVVARDAAQEPLFGFSAGGVVVAVDASTGDDGVGEGEGEGEGAGSADALGEALGAGLGDGLGDGAGVGLGFAATAKHSRHG